MAQLMDDTEILTTSGAPPPPTDYDSENYTLATGEVLQNIHPEKVDGVFVVALICFCLGAILLVVGYIRLMSWWIDTKKKEKEQEILSRHVQHLRHLEEYSVRTGDATSVFGDNVSLYLAETRSMNGSVGGARVKVGPFPKPSVGDDDDEDDEKKRQSDSSQSSSNEKGEKRLSDETPQRKLQDYNQNDVLDNL